MFCLRYGHVIRVPASGRFINASTCRHVTDRTGSETEDGETTGSDELEG
ncbi:hypothetical protein SLEP1_g22156 [Rubroshorea leprosula]|uniref:Uncharacterized protein n=1 Tax=Rubroshorea leprosula TaxID=152421 RepID=A0AAV5JEE4_9ROSI|nr:hypothetical protein SLEP1_g22156 [Rubroshorea leprosula]